MGIIKLTSLKGRTKQKITYLRSRSDFSSYKKAKLVFIHQQQVTNDSNNNESAINTMKIHFPENFC